MAYPIYTSDHDRGSFMQGHIACGGPQSGYPPNLPPTNVTPVINQFPSNLIGYYLKAGILPDGQSSWDHPDIQRMTESESKLDEILRKDPKENRPDEAFRNKHLKGNRIQLIFRILGQHNTPMTDMEWKLVSVKLVQEKVKINTAKNTIIKMVTKSIRIILKRGLRSVLKTVQQQSISFPMATGLPHGHQGSPMVTFGHPNVPLHTTPIIHQNSGHHGNHGTGALFGEQTHDVPPPPPDPRLPEGMINLGQRVEEVVDDYPYEEETKPKKSHKKDEKKQKKKGEPIDIYIPTIRNHERHSSKSSSRPPSLSESDSYSVLDSPLTSVSGDWQDLKHGAKHYKKYPGGRGGDDSRRDRRTSHGAHIDEGYVVVARGGRHKQDTPKYPQEFQDQIVAGVIERVAVEVDKLQDRRKLQQDQEALDRFDRRLGNIETILHQGGRETYSYPRERAPWDRSYSETHDVGYLGGRQRNSETHDVRYLGDRPRNRSNLTYRYT